MALALGLILPGCGQSAPLKVAAHVWPGYELMFLAKEQGWLDPERVELVSTPFASSSLEALISGQVDAAAVTLDEVLSARDRGLPLTVVLVFNVSAGSLMLDKALLFVSAAELSMLMHSRGLLPRVDEELHRLIDDRYLPAVKPR